MDRNVSHRITHLLDALHPDRHPILHCNLCNNVHDHLGTQDIFINKSIEAINKRLQRK